MCWESPLITFYDFLDNVCVQSCSTRLIEPASSLVRRCPDQGIGDPEAGLSLGPLVCRGIHASRGEVLWAWGYFASAGSVVTLHLDAIDVHVARAGVLALEDGVGEHALAADHGCFVKLGIEHLPAILWVGPDGTWNASRLLSSNTHVLSTTWNNAITMNTLLHVRSWRLSYRRCNGITWDGAGSLKSGDMLVLRQSWTDEVLHVLQRGHALSTFLALIPSFTLAHSAVHHHRHVGAAVDVESVQKLRHLATASETEHWIVMTSDHLKLENSKPERVSACWNSSTKWWSTWRRAISQKGTEAGTAQ